MSIAKEQSSFMMYSTNGGTINIEVRTDSDNETVWLNQKQIAELFNTTKQNISLHIDNILKKDELDNSVVKDFLTTASDGKNYNIEHYNLDMIIAIGYRVNSESATQFRKWATSILKEYFIKGFTIDDERLKQGKALFGKDYFKELLETVRSIRSSERRIWFLITDIFQECSIDYDKKSQVTQSFFATVQNKFHYAITGHTAAEIVYNNADSKKENMGLTTWKNLPKGSNTQGQDIKGRIPKGRIVKSDTTIAKNYLDEKEIKTLERTISSYFDYIENLIEREHSFTMEDFSSSINKFLSFNKFDILETKGSISHKVAEKKASEEYDIFNKEQKIENDFEKNIEKAIKEIK